MEQMYPHVVKLESDTQYRRLIGPGQSAVLKSGLVTLAPGSSIGEHSTDSREEVIIFLEADRALVTWGDGGSLEVAKNTLVYMPAFTKHNVRNEGTVPCRYVYVTAGPVPTGS